MKTTHELETAWKLFNLLEELSNILFDQYHDYLMERHLDEETLLYFEKQCSDLKTKTEQIKRQSLKRYQIIR